MASIQNDLLDGIAQMIANAGIASYDTAGEYSAGDTGIFFKIVNPTPDRIVTLTAYQVSDDPTMPQSRFGVQVRVRGGQDPRDVDELGDSIFALLHGLINTQFNSVFAEQVLRQSSITLGQDTAKRWERADAFYIDVATPPTSNRPDGGSW
jgi:5-carboxymethyl-2-hydroxymuconate isomerase